MNWGVGLIILYSSFVVFMLSLVYKCNSHKFDLVSSDYYEKELAYQKVMDGDKNKALLESPVIIAQNNNAINITLPASQTAIQNGSLFFYRPSDASKDFKLAFNSINTNILRDRFQKGLYKVKITWEQSGELFYDEQNLTIQ